MKKIVFSDLDGTLLDHETYSYEKAKNSLEVLSKKEIPLIFCTSKTRAEIEYWRKKIGNKDPFISENGGGIFIPKSYFTFDFNYNEKDKNNYVINLGANYNKLKQSINKLKEKFEIKSFSDMSTNEIANDANLNLTQAKLAKKREYDLPFKILNKNQEEEIIRYIKKQGLKITTGGRYHHLIGDNNKGEAVKILSRLYKKKFDNIYTIGVGDSENDFAMLDVVDSPYLVMKKDGSYASSDYTLAGDVGPAGWKKVIDIELRA